MTCARSLPSCRGEVRLYRQTLRPVHEIHRLCEGCVRDLSAEPLRLDFVPVETPRVVFGRWREQDRLAAPA